MLDREEEEVPFASLTSKTLEQSVTSDLLEIAQELKSVVFLLKGLYGQMKEERGVITLASGQMAHAAKQFEEYLEQFESFEKSCQQAIAQRVKTELKQSIKESAQIIAQEVTDLLYEPLHRGINSLWEASAKVAEQHEYQKGAKFWEVALVFVVTSLAGVFGGFVVHYLTN